MKTLLSTSLRPRCPGHCGGSCCFLGIHYLTMERATANRMCPGGHGDPLRVREKEQVSVFTVQRTCLLLCHTPSRPGPRQSSRKLPEMGISSC